MAAGLGSRLAPLTDRWPKPVLPIDGRPVVVTLVHELASAGIDRFAIVTGHLAEQVEALLAPLPYRFRFISQPEPLGSADAVERARAAAPFLVAGADTRFAEGDVGRFISAANGVDGAVAVRRQPDRPAYTRIEVADGRVQRVAAAPEADTDLSAAPLWLIGPRVEPFLRPLPGKPPHELADVLQLAIDAGAYVSAIQVGPTRDLTSPADLVRENFPYLR
jgi:UDP-N-acetylglucosamine diphosphorylase / glucose-1-phosphate thymidylyltransferase / UDP-N-acetylgalactosamine diphosphorylase / glucosamine-1-phosphate N-acetyltransferase / galactosamine-1-phosphate N-acetyltransferase